MHPSEAYILNQPEPFRGILLFLQATIERQFPVVELRFKYRIPFYYLDEKPFCYLNQSKDYVDLGFWHAAHLSVHLEHLTVAGRKVMRSLRYRRLEDIDMRILAEVLADAYAVRGKKFHKGT